MYGMFCLIISEINISQDLKNVFLLYKTSIDGLDLLNLAGSGG